MAPGVGRPWRVYVARHGLKEENVPGKDNFSLNLSPEGKEGLAELASFFEEHNVRFGRVLASPYLRCRQTAACFEGLLAPGSGVELEPGLCEVLSDRTGLRNTVGLQGAAALAALVPRLEAVMREEGGLQSASALLGTHELDVDQEKGQDSHRSVMERGVRVAERLTSDHFERGPLLLVTHGGTAKAIISAMSLGEMQPYDRVKTPEMGSMTLLEKSRPDENWRVVSSVHTARLSDMSWEVRWRRGRASEDGDIAKL